MDANRARFHALWGHAGDWNAITEVRANNVEDNGGALRLKSQPPIFGDVSAIKLKPEARRGAARDRFGNWYWIAPSQREILVQSSGTGEVSSFWPLPGPRRTGPFASVPLPQIAGLLAGLAVTTHHNLVVGTLEPPGLLAFDLAAGGLPRRVAGPNGVQFAPFDLAALGDGVVVLDRRNHAAWAFDRDLAPRPVAQLTEVRDLFQPVDPKSAAAPRRRAASAAPVTLPADWPAPLAVAAVSRNVAWFLHETTQTAPVAPNQVPSAAEGSLLAKVDWSAPFPLTSGPVLGTRANSVLKVDAKPVGGHDFVLAAPNRLEVALADGVQAIAFDIKDLHVESDFIPLRRFGGLGYIGAAPGDTSATRPSYDSAGTWATTAIMPRPRFAQSATLTVPDAQGWDGKAAGCVWHRIFLDACLPPGCTIRLIAEVSEDRNTWRTATTAGAKPLPTDPEDPWQPDPRRRAEGCELPFAPALPAGFGTWETLLHGASGRFLRLTLMLTGDGTRTPRIRAVRAWYPRFSYLEHYLPAIYRDDKSSADFLERFLANAEGTLTGIEDKVVAARSLVDPRTAPAEALDWLSSWLGVAPSPRWDEQRKRIFLRYAPTILRRRGTIRGLQWALHLELDPELDQRIFEIARTDTSPYRIVETFRRRATAAVELGDPTVLDLPRHADAAVGLTRRWRPDAGPAALNRAYAETLNRQASVPFPLRPPAEANDAEVWQTFSRRALGFIPQSCPGDPDSERRWAAFLRRRYRIDNPPGIPLPATLDVRPSVAADWYLFETVVLAALRSAHQFEVLIPTVTDGARATVSPSPADLEQSRQRRNLAWQVVRREAPAHCRFEVRLYASAFRVGGARVGADTLLGLGWRSPEFYDEMVLDGAFLGEAFLRVRPPLDASGLTILGQTPTFRARRAQGASPR